MRARQAGPAGRSGVERVQMSGSGTRSRSTLRRDRFWTCARRPERGRARGCQCGGGIRRASTGRRRKQREEEGRQTVPADRDWARTERKNESRKGKMRARRAGPTGRSGVERVQMSGSESQEEYILNAT